MEFEVKIEEYGRACWKSEARNTKSETSSETEKGETPNGWLGGRRECRFGISLSEL
jgi:hypothetical protein